MPGPHPPPISAKPLQDGLCLENRTHAETDICQASDRTQQEASQPEQETQDGGYLELGDRWLGGIWRAAQAAVGSLSHSHQVRTGHEEWLEFHQLWATAFLKIILTSHRPTGDRKALNYSSPTIFVRKGGYGEKNHSLWEVECKIQPHNPFVC